jgi:hypothetical protein
VKHFLSAHHSRALHHACAQGKEKRFILVRLYRRSRFIRR